MLFCWSFHFCMKMYFPAIYNNEPHIHFGWGFSHFASEQKWIVHRYIRFSLFFRLIFFFFSSFLCFIELFIWPFYVLYLNVNYLSSNFTVAYLKYINCFLCKETGEFVIDGFRWLWMLDGISSYYRRIDIMINETLATYLRWHIYDTKLVTPIIWDVYQLIPETNK